MYVLWLLIRSVWWPQVCFDGLTAAGDKGATLGPDFVGALRAEVSRVERDQPFGVDIAVPGEGPADNALSALASNSTASTVAAALQSILKMAGGFDYHVGGSLVSEPRPRRALGHGDGGPAAGAVPPQAVRDPAHRADHGGGGRLHRAGTTTGRWCGRPPPGSRRCSRFTGRKRPRTSPIRRRCWSTPTVTRPTGRATSWRPPATIARRGARPEIRGVRAQPGHHAVAHLRRRPERGAGRGRPRQPLCRRRRRARRGAVGHPRRSAARALCPSGAQAQPGRCVTEAGARGPGRWRWPTSGGCARH